MQFKIIKLKIKHFRGTNFRGWIGQNV